MLGSSAINRIRTALGALKAPARQALQTKMQTSGLYQEAMTTYAALSMLVDLRFRPKGTNLRPTYRLPTSWPATYQGRHRATHRTHGHGQSGLGLHTDPSCLDQPGYPSRPRHDPANSPGSPDRTRPVSRPAHFLVDLSQSALARPRSERLLRAEPAVGYRLKRP